LAVQGRVHGLDSGGALRAGKASAGMTKKYGAKKDANHFEIMNYLKKLGAYVLDMSTLGQGVPDLMVLINGKNYLVDIKNPKTGYGRRGLNERQKRWAEEWQGGKVYLISTVDEVILLIQGKEDKLKSYPPD